MYAWIPVVSVPFDITIHNKCWYQISRQTNDKTFYTKIKLNHIRSPTQIDPIVCCFYFTFLYIFSTGILTLLYICSVEYLPAKVCVDLMKFHFSSMILISYLRSTAQPVWQQAGITAFHAKRILGFVHLAWQQLSSYSVFSRLYLRKYIQFHWMVWVWMVACLFMGSVG